MVDSDSRIVLRGHAFYIDRLETFAGSTYMKAAFVVCVALLLLPQAHATAATPIESLTQATTQKQRRSAAETVQKLGAESVPQLVAALQRKRQSTDSQRRTVLKRIRAAVPNKKGRFRTPGRNTSQKQQQRDQYDWLPKLFALTGEEPALGEVITDVVIIRTLAQSRTVAAGDAILAFAFDKTGLIYRDECGRYLRRMSPYSLPALLRAAPERTRYQPKHTYAVYQLERLDRQSAPKAMADAMTDEDLAIAVLKAFGDSHYRQAVGTVLDKVNHVSPRVRTAARAAWQEYIAGRPPPSPPRRRLTEPGGHLSKKKKPLWLDHRALAAVKLRQKLTQLTGKPPQGASLSQMTEQLYKVHDDHRRQAARKAYETGMQAAAAGDYATAIDTFDRLLADTQDHPQRGQMAKTYANYGRSLAQQKKWRQAARAFAKARDLTEGDASVELKAAYHHNLAKAITAEGGDAKRHFEKAAALDPQYSTTLPTADPVHTNEPAQGRKRWMLHTGIAAGAIAAVLLILGLHRRRRR